jgi:hypothetical protein
VGWGWEEVAQTMHKHVTVKTIKEKKVKGRENKK